MDLPTLEAEERFWTQGMWRVAGLDEAGRGAWAGPVVAAAVILPRDDGACAALTGVRDSKQVSPLVRETLAVRIRAVALAVGIGRGEPQEIDALGIVPATRLAMQRALEALSVAPQALVIDALPLPDVDLPQDVFPYADVRSLAVAAASIIAKVSRDHWMVDVAEADFPGYGFAQHKGYGTRQHREALTRLGVCPLHRLTFRPVAVFVNSLNG
ncbi:MAG TPA: ribonuclease HII [Anaerolineae bacterium]|nr:ribonuclease HII [Anaerolineae bacterium]HQH39941.1 ribonuclease HII [Anaerolineae bacterium]